MNVGSEREPGKAECDAASKWLQIPETVASCGSATQTTPRFVAEGGAEAAGQATTIWTFD